MEHAQRGADQVIGVGLFACEAKVNNPPYSIIGDAISMIALFASFLQDSKFEYSMRS